ncbi:MAG: OmpA family protein [Nitrospinae bacterium]|nr:OmpA family protein [Nitrospinota bacterium]
MAQQVPPKKKEEAAAPQPVVFVKRVKKVHGGHHGGSWKVAYADFVTAMMAFFLLMWLVSMTTEQQKLGLGDYFQNFSPFQHQGISPYQETSMTPTDGMASKADKGKSRDKENLEVLFQKIKSDVSDKFKSVQDQILMDFVSDGLRIQIIDTEGSSMFNSGSPDLNNWSKEVLQMVSENVKHLPNKVAIEGHTDSVPFKASGMSNWELSTARASMARKEFERNGIEPERFSKIVGYADTQPFVKYDTKDSKNRRINIILMREDINTVASRQEKSITETPLPQSQPRH